MTGKAYIYERPCSLDFKKAWLGLDSSFSANTKPCDNVVISLQLRTTNTQCCCDVDYTTSKLQHCSNVVSTLEKKSLVRVVLWMLYWQCGCNIEITTSNSQRLRNVNTTMPNSQSCADVIPTLDSKFTSHHNISWILSWQRWYNVVTSRRRH